MERRELLSGRVELQAADTTRTELLRLHHSRWMPFTLTRRWFLRRPVALHAFAPWATKLGGFLFARVVLYVS